MELDSILLCIGMGIPLKRLKEFYDDDVTLKSRQMLEEGQRIAKTRIEELKIGLQKIEHTLKRQNENRPYEGKEGNYRREIGRSGADGKRTIPAISVWGRKGASSSISGRCYLSVCEWICAQIFLF